MKKIYLLRGPETSNYKNFKKQVLTNAEKLLELPEISSVKITITDKPPPRVSIIPFKRKKLAIVSVYSSRAGIADKLMLEYPEVGGSYEVSEALPVSYDKTWEDGNATPGVCLLTLFQQREDLNYDTFIDRWHNNHTPLSLKIHPLWNYSRNVVTKKETGAESWDGIVEEQFRQTSDLLNPFRFFGNPLVIAQRMWMVYSDTRSFLDYGSIEPYLATEYVLKS